MVNLLPFAGAVLPARAPAFRLCALLLGTVLAWSVSAEPPQPYTPPAPVDPLPEFQQPEIRPEIRDEPQPRETPAPIEDMAADPQPDDQDQAAAQPTLPLAELRSFAEIFGRIKSDYVEQVSDRDLLAAAIRGLLAGLDPHSTYLDEQEYEDLQVGTKGEFGGLGIEVGMEDGFVKVIAPMDDTPAQRAGVQAGDLIVRIDGHPVKGMNLGDAVKRMRGEPGTRIELTIMRDGEDKPLKISIERDIIQVASVKGQVLEPGYVYIRIANFQARTTEDMRRRIEELRLEHQDENAAPQPIKGLVLDLRNNPGGVLNSAVGVSDAFLRGGLIVYTQGRVEDARMEFKAGPDDILEGAPLVVLVNGGSASASEIVAGALQDQGRAIIMGSDTFGKGSVQTIVPIDGQTALKLTTARYYTPSGRSIQAHGIVPDIRLERGSLTLADKPTVAPLREANLVRHLEEEALSDTPDNTEEFQQPLAARDYPLSEALNVLKALSIARTRTPEAASIHQPPALN